MSTEAVRKTRGRWSYKGKNIWLPYGVRQGYQVQDAHQRQTYIACGRWVWAVCLLIVDWLMEALTSILIGSLCHSKGCGGRMSMCIYWIDACMCVLGSWLVLEGPNEKKGVLSLNRGPAWNWLRTSNQVSINYTAIIVWFCKFALAKHGKFIISSAWSRCCPPLCASSLVICNIWYIKTQECFWKICSDFS